MKKLLVLALLAVVVAPALRAADVRANEAIWIEGENASATTFNKHGWYTTASVNTAMLSGGAWLGHFSPTDAATATYSFDVTEGGDYTFWLRCNPHNSKMEYALDGGASQAVDISDPRERANLLTEGIDIRFLAWVKVGKLTLKPGKHSLVIKALKGEAEAHAGIDCLAIVNFAWAPTGAAKPPTGGAAGAPATAAAAAGGAAGAAGAPGQGEFVWIEGESSTKTNFNRHPWYSTASVNKAALSGGDWLAHYSADQPASAEWAFTVKQAGKFALWVRLNPFEIKHTCSVDGAAPQPLDGTDAREVTVALSEGRDIRQIGWVKGPTFDLAPGAHTVSIRVEKGPREAHGAIDALVLISFPWAPTGIAKPTVPTGGPAAVAPDTWFPVFPDDDAFSDKSIIDMRSLVDQTTGIPAGKFGFVQRKGEEFVFSNRADVPVKFWGTAAGPAATPQLQQQQARFYVKHGMNILRKHTVQAEIGLLRKNPGAAERTFDPQRLDRFDKWFSILKENGIYMDWSCFYPHVITAEDGYPADLYAELPDADGGKSTSGIVNFMPKLQAAEWEWQKALLLHKNPYTGMRYIDDPALAIIEVHNEDCIFFHSPLNTLSGGKLPKHNAVLTKGWADWLKARYKDDVGLRQAWGAGLRQGDSVNNANMAIYGAWEMGTAGPTVNNNVDQAGRARMGDFIRYLAETQRGYYEQRLKLLHELGYKASALTTAWHAGGPAADPANTWCDDAMDMITRHNYFGGGAGGHGIAVGKVNNETHMGQPGGGILASGFYQVEDKPFIMTEWTVLPPNQWKAEIAPLFAFYGMGLQGWDASFHFAGSRPRMGSGWPNMNSYVTETPHYIGQFPALSFAIYHGHVKEAPLAAARRLPVDEIFKGYDALNQDFTGGGYDAKALQGNLATPENVLAIGRVTAKIADGQQRSANVDWTKYWDKAAKVVKSMTGQLTWDYGKRVVTVQSDKTQAVIGFAGGGDYDLPGVGVKVKTPFVSLIFTPLDDKPLAESKHILITAMARDMQTGTRYNADGTELIAAGAPPLLMEPVQATLTFKGAPITSVKVVDIYGVPTATDVAREGNTVTIDGRYATYYYEVKR